MDYSILFIKVDKNINQEKKYSFRRMPALILKNDQDGEEYFDVMEVELQND